MSANSKGRNDYLALGDYNAECAECGAKFKASQLKKNWKGFQVCPRDWEPRHPQDFVKVVSETSVPWSQEYPPSFVDFPSDG